MTPYLLLLIAIAQVALVSGQIILKHGMNRLDDKPPRYGRVTMLIAAGTAMLTLWFLLWAGLLQRLDLSYVYPFEGLSPLLLVLAAWLILREPLGWRSWLGVGLISAGTVLVGVSG